MDIVSDGRNPVTRLTVEYLNFLSSYRIHAHLTPVYRVVGYDNRCAWTGYSFHIPFSIAIAERTVSVAGA